MNSNIKDIYGLTPSQQGIYARYFQNPDTKTYHLQNLFKISKNSDIDILRVSVELLSLRHQVLKTSFAVLKSTGAIKQVVLKNRIPEFSFFETEEPFSQNLLNKLINEYVKHPFDLQKDVLFKVAVIDFTDERFMLIYSHHIILDGWCIPIIINDLQKYYEKLSSGCSIEELSGEIVEEAESQTSYAKYAGWIKKQDKKEASEYWEGLLEDCNFAHIFGKEKNGNEKNEDIVTEKTHLSDELSLRIEQFAKENRISLNTVFECAFSIALQKYSGSDDVIFDKVISGRGITLKNIENTVGTFINTVPVRVRSEEYSVLGDLIKQIQGQTVNANKYGILPLAEVYKSSGIDGRLIDALFVFENYFTGDISDVKNASLSLEPVSFNEYTEFNMTVTVFKDNSGYTIRYSYAKEMYTQKDISAFIEGYMSVLMSSLDISKQIKDICITDTDFISNLNDTSHSFGIPEDSTVYSLFEKNARENADKICIKTAEKEISFIDFLEISEKLDAEIRMITKGEKSVVAIIAERSIEMYASVYAIIRAGNAYLPIDPDYPQERIESILENSKAAAVVAQDKFTFKAGKHPCIDVTDFIAGAKGKTAAIPDCTARPDDTAYVIYTSGSTGVPKGAKVSHKSAVNRILWMHDKYPLGKNGVILQKTPYTFDVSVWELFWWGMCGGCMAVSKPGEHFLPAKIFEEVEKNKVTHLHFVPSVFELFLNYIESHKDECNKFDSVRHVFLSGEALSAALVNRFYNLFDYGKVTLHNFYGPTECAIDVTYYDCVEKADDPVPIGKPVYNTQIYVVDKYCKLVPVGVTGELCIAGDNVGQGYLNNLKLTMEKFIDNPFGKGKLYKTGDLAFLRDDGNIIFMGRNDSQIKLNGQRIELGEIENVINKIKGITSVTVISKKNNGKDMLIAFYTGEEMEAKHIKEICSVKLPKYMVPNAFVHLDKMPLNRSGKLDRRVLTQKEIEILNDNENDFPQNETEKLICTAFENILKVKPVGRNSDFFEMGGTSLSMISILSETGFEKVTAAEFMRNPTPALLSCVIEARHEVNLEYLEPLYIADNPQQVLVLFPFAGGGAESYGTLVNSLKKKNDRISLYFVRYLHSSQECRKAADEIAAVRKNSEIMIYSHCAGSAVALQVISFLEDSKISVRQYFAGASIPPAKPKDENLWNKIPDKMLKSILVKAGAHIKELSDEKTTDLLKAFRKDTDFANISFAEFKGRINTPVTVIISKKDIFTKNYRQAKKLWGKYTSNVTTVKYIDCTSHYFQAQNSELLADSIFETLV